MITDQFVTDLIIKELNNQFGFVDEIYQMNLKITKTSKLSYKIFNNSYIRFCPYDYMKLIFLKKIFKSKKQMSIKYYIYFNLLELLNQTLSQTTLKFISPNIIEIKEYNINHFGKISSIIFNDAYRRIIVYFHHGTNISIPVGFKLSNLGALYKKLLKGNFFQGRINHAHV